VRTRVLRGKAHCFDGVLDVDWEICPIEDLNYLRSAQGSNLSYQEKQRYLARNCLTRLDPGFPGKVTPGDMLIGNKGVGWGHDHDHAVMALKGVGLAAVICESTRQNFQRNCLHHGLPLVRVDGVFSSVATGDVLELDLNAGTLINETSGVRLIFKPYPEFILETLDAGGLYAGHRAHAATY
jgi:3-isopropylmalate/(R)-2-methylmalate dehydratase small subunit